MPHPVSIGARKFLTGFGWLTATSYVNRLFGFVTTLILAKLLAPDDFGLVAMGGIMMEMLKIFRDMGLGQALIYRKDRIELASDTAMLMILALNVLLFACAALAAPFVSDFFDSPSLTPVLIVMAANLVPIGIRSVPESLLRKNVDFRKLMAPEVVSALISSILGIVLAWQGAGVWSLVARTSCASVLNAILIWFVTDYRPRLRFDQAVARELLGYGKFVVGATLLSVALYNVDRLYVAKLASVTDLGVYTMALAVAAMPVTEFGHLICRVAFPVFCKLNQDPERLRTVFLSTYRYNALLVAPIGIGLAVFGDELARSFLGTKWQGLGPALQILALASVARALSSLIHELLRATGAVRTVQRFTMARLVLVATAGPLTLLQFGLPGLCALLVISNVAVLAVEMAVCIRTIDCRAAELLGLTTRTLALAAVCIGSVYYAYVQVTTASGVGLTIAIVLSAAVYLAALLVTDRRIVSEARAVFRQAGPSAPEARH